MKNQFIFFQDHHYAYEGSGAGEDVAMAIGAREAAFFVDLAVAYIFDRLEVKGVFKDAIYKCILRDDGFLVVDRKWDEEQARSWMETFQKNNIEC